MRIFALLTLALATIALAYSAAAAPVRINATLIEINFNTTDADYPDKSQGFDGAADGPATLPAEAAGDGLVGSSAPLTQLDICNNVRTGMRLLVWPPGSRLRDARILAPGACASLRGRRAHPADDVLIALYREHPHRGPGWWAAAAVAGAVDRPGAHPEASASDLLAAPACAASPGKRAFRSRWMTERFAGENGGIDVEVVRLPDRDDGGKVLRVSVEGLESTLVGRGCDVEADVRFQ
ncbi:hypothetical protein DFJ74DRAFT_705990 [Hyaloraphidium curvatum]|nr:hypothetical protein DFJ74DRAFT_705990 [Hyaloraphidium curvatum]